MTSQNIDLSSWDTLYNFGTDCTSFSKISSIVTRVSVSADTCLSSRYQAMAIFISLHVTVYSEWEGFICNCDMDSAERIQRYSIPTSDEIDHRNKIEQSALT
jgi:hypothetical protein